MKDRASYFVFCLLCFIWGSSWLAIKIGLEDAPPLKAAGYRLVIGIPFILLITGKRFFRIKLDLKDWLFLSGLGILNFGFAYYFIYWAEQYISSGLTSILFSTFPLFVAAYSRFYLPEEQLTWKRILGMILGISGTAIIYSEQISFSWGRPFVAMLAVTAGAAMIALVTVKAKQYLVRGEPVAVTVVQMIPAMILLLAMSFVLERDRPFVPTTRSVGALLYLSCVVTTVAFLSYYWLLKREQAIRLTAIALVTPVIAVFLGWVVLSESITILQGIGAVIVLSGVRLVTGK